MIKAETDSYGPGAPLAPILANPFMGYHEKGFG